LTIPISKIWVILSQNVFSADALRSVAIDALGSVSDGDNATIATQNGICIEFGFQSFEDCIPSFTA
jgi:hypothetical protein